MQNKSKKSSDNGSKSNGTSQHTGMQTSQLMKLFEDQLKDIYWAEKALTKAIPKMIKNVTSSELIGALEHHLEETRVQVIRVEKVFESIGKKAVAKKCVAMEGLIAEAGEIMESCEPGSMCDAGIIAAAQKVEHYELATYGTLRQFALTLELTDAVDLLDVTFNEERMADEKLSEIAMTAVNIEAAVEEAETV